MNNESWKEEVKAIIKKGCTDSDIEDYLEVHPGCNEKEVWDYVYEQDAPKECRGCEYIQMSGLYPCNSCVRQKRLKDYYKKKEGRI